MSYTPHDTEFSRLIDTFREIRKIDSEAQRRFELNLIAPAFGLPRAEARKLYELWLKRENPPPDSG